MSAGSFWHTKQFCHIFTPEDQLFCSILHENWPTTYNEHFSAYNIMTFVCLLVDCTRCSEYFVHAAFWSMDMTGVYACLCEATCDVTTVPSHLKWYNFQKQKVEVQLLTHVFEQHINLAVFMQKLPGTRVFSAVSLKGIPNGLCCGSLGLIFCSTASW